jgi:hypothetical protein
MASSRLEALEHGAEHAVELVEIALVLHQRGAREVVEILHRRPARSASIASISVRYSRKVTGTISCVIS